MLQLFALLQLEPTCRSRPSGLATRKTPTFFCNRARPHEPIPPAACHPLFSAPRLAPTPAVLFLCGGVTLCPRYMQAPFFAAHASGFAHIDQGRFVHDRPAAVWDHWPWWRLCIRRTGCRCDPLLKHTNTVDLALTLLLSAESDGNVIVRVDGEFAQALWATASCVSAIDGHEATLHVLQVSSFLSQLAADSRRNFMSPTDDAWAQFVVA